GKFVGGEIGEIVPRELKVRPCVFELSEEPEKLRETFLNEIGVGKILETTQFELFLIQRGLENASEDLFNALAIAKYDADPAKLELTDSFDGFLTIIDQEIALGNIAVENGNMYDPQEKITVANIGEKLKEMWRSSHKTFKAKAGGLMYMSVNMAEMYDDWYFANHEAWPNLDTSGQKTLEGTNGKCTIVPLGCIPDDNDQVILTQDGVITYGTESLSDMKNLVAFPSGNPYAFTATMKYLFGIQLNSIHERRFKVAKSYAEAETI
ncbi:MAG: hypothetical protein ACOYOV_12480, partial [Bacteroidales bacterium]